MAELYNEFEGLITSFFIKSFTCLLISSLWKGESVLFSIYGSVIDCNNFVCRYIGMF